MECKIKVGITQGDINGVGYEVILKTLSDPHIVELCTPAVSYTHLDVYKRQPIFLVGTQGERIEKWSFSLCCFCAPQCCWARQGGG